MYRVSQHFRTKLFFFFFENDIMHCLLLLLSQPFYLYCCRREFSSCQAQSIFYSVDANSKILSEDERKVSITRKLHKGTYFHHGATNLTFPQQKYPYFLWFEVVLQMIVEYNLTKLSSLVKISQKTYYLLQDYQNIRIVNSIEFRSVRICRSLGVSELLGLSKVSQLQNH